MILTLLSFLASPLGRIAGIVGAASVFIVAFALDQRHRGAEKVRAQVERNNAAVTSKAGNAGRRSLDPASRGLSNPYYRAD